MARPASQPARISSENQVLNEQQWIHAGTKINEARSKLNSLKMSVQKLAKDMSSDDASKATLIQVNGNYYLLLHLMFQLLNLGLKFS